MNSLVEKARDLAQWAHLEQRRKYTGEPYFNHCEGVALQLGLAGMPSWVIAAGYLHDVIEDCGITADDLRWEFRDADDAEAMVRLVLEVTDVSKPSDGNRAVRKAKDREHLARSSREGASIKCADLVDNTRSIVRHDRSFAKVYLREKRALLPVLLHAQPTLYVAAESELIKAEEELRAA